MTVWEHAKAEVREGWGTVARWGKRSFAVVAALHVLAGAWYLVAGGGAFGDRLFGFGVIAVYGVAQGVVWAGGVAVAALVLRLAGWGTIVPFVLLPAGVWLSCLLGSDWVAGLAAGLLGTLADRAGELGSVRMSCGHPVLVLILLPIVALHFLTSGAVLAALLKLVAASLLLVVAGAVAGAALSIPPLLATTASRLLGRARDREQNGDMT